MSDDFLDVSIIIPDYKSPHLLEVIQSASDLKPREIIVANYKIAENEQNQFPAVQFLNFEKQKYPGDARNEGALKAASENLLFIDSDVILTAQGKAFIREKIKGGFDEDQIIWGLYSEGRSQHINTKIQYRLLRYRFSKLFADKAEAANRPYYGQSSHFLIKKKNFNDIGQFNPYLKVREDAELCVRAHHLGKKNLVCEEFTADHFKKFHFVELIKEYTRKTWHATWVKTMQPKIFNRPHAQIGIRLFLSWIVFPVLLGFTLMAVYIFKATSLPIFFPLLVALFVPRLLLPDIHKGLSLQESIAVLFFFPLSGACFILGSASGILSALGYQMIRSIRSLLDWVSAAYRVLSRNGMPIQIIHFITSRCNLRCNHCFYKETLDKSDSGEQSLAMITKTTKEIGPVLWYALGGGEPYLRNDLPQLHEIINRNCRPKFFTVPTNGWYADRVFNDTLRMMQRLNGRGSVIIQFSLDGPQEIHDRIRGPGSWEKVEKSFKRLERLRELYPNLLMSVITVVTEENAHVYPAFVDELVERLKPNQVNINLFRYGSLDHPPLPEKTLEAYKNAVERYEELMKNKALAVFSFLGARVMRLKEALQKDLIYRVAKYDEFVTPCMAGTISYVIWEDGRINPCEILDDTVGTLDDPHSKTTFRDHVKSKEAKILRKRIKDEKCKCTYECAMSSNTIFSPPMTVKMIKAYFTSRV